MFISAVNIRRWHSNFSHTHHKLISINWACRMHMTWYHFKGCQDIQWGLINLANFKMNIEFTWRLSFTKELKCWNSKKIASECFVEKCSFIVVLILLIVTCIIIFTTHSSNLWLRSTTQQYRSWKSVEICWRQMRMVCSSWLVLLLAHYICSQLSSCLSC